MNDPYAILGVTKNASAEDIKKAYKEKAMLHHPDRNKGDATSEEIFKNINNAYDILKDPQKRAIHDQGGQSPFATSYGGQQGGANPFRTNGFNVPPDFHDILNEMFGGQRPSQAYNSFNQHINLNYQITLEEAYHGKETDVGFSTRTIGQRTVRVKIPPAIEDGIKIRYTGLGEHTNTKAAPGDLYISIGIIPHPRFMRIDKYTLLTKQKITYLDAILGSSFEIATIDGTSISIQVPAGVNSGAILKASGKGMRTEDNKRGDLLVELQLVAPTLNAEQLEHIRKARG